MLTREDQVEIEGARSAQTVEPAVKPVPVRPARKKAGYAGPGDTAPLAPYMGAETSPPPVLRGILRGLWRRRAAIAGVAALALAVVGEHLMRVYPGTQPVDSQLGTRLVQVAVLLVGLVAWVRDGPWVRRQTATTDRSAVASTLPVRTAGASGMARTPLPSRPARANGRHALVQSPRRGLMARIWALPRRYADFRVHLGWRGTALGLLVVAALSAWGYLLLRQSFADPLAPWVWLAMLLVLIVTFVGTGQDSTQNSKLKTQNLLGHDPAEPRVEPPVSIWEWLAVGLILALAAGLRLWNLDGIPIGPYIDEADRALEARHINRGELMGDNRPFTFFGTAWWGVPNLYFWLVGRSMQLFGDNLQGARMVHALAGIAAVWFVYRLGRVAWSPRAGLLAAGLLAVSDFAIQFSRTAGESTITMLAWLVCFYFLFKGLKTLHPLPFVFSGVAGGLALYGYASGKLLPLVLVPVGIYLLARWGRRGARLLLPRLALLALAMALTYAPNGLYVLSDPAGTTGFMMRYNGVSIFQYTDRYFTTYQTDNWAPIIGKQYEQTYGAFDVGAERGPFYPTGQPLLPVPWAALWVLGTAYVVWRVGDARYALLGAWLLGGLAGAALTNETPSMQRVAGMVPLLALLPAIFLDRVVGPVTSHKSQVTSRRPAKQARLHPDLRLAYGRGMPRPYQPVIGRAVNVALALLVVLLGAQTVTYYFGPYTAKGLYSEFTIAGRYMEGLDPRRNIVYMSDVPLYLGSRAPTTFLADRVPLRQMGNPNSELPVTANEGKAIHFLFFPANDPMLDVIRSYYPGGITSTLTLPDGRPLISTLRVRKENIDTKRHVVATYRPSTGDPLRRQETRIGTLEAAGSRDLPSPVNLSYPLQVEWAGGLIAPRYGAYRFSVDAPDGGVLAIDGRRVLTATEGSTVPVEGMVVLASGAHEMRLAGTMSNRDARVDLRWAGGHDALQPVARRFLWDGARGALLRESYQGMGDRKLLTDPVLDLGEAVPAFATNNGVLKWIDLNVGLGSPLFTVWRGSLRAPAAGDYVFSIDSETLASLWIDGRMVGTQRVGEGTVNLPARIYLEAGEHSIEIRSLTERAISRFVLYWQLPGGQVGLVPPEALHSPGGVWLPDERPNPPSLDGLGLGP